MDPITILFGTESGNAQSLAKRAGEDLASAGIPARVVDMMDFDHVELTKLARVLIITSTYGNGDPPSNAEALHAFVMKQAPRLEQLQFSVCALGDTTYDRFANCGKEFDERLGELGARRIAPRRDCDIDYDDPFEAWLAEVIAFLKGDVPAAETSSPAAVTVVDGHPDEDPPGTRRNPVLARVRENVNLNGPGAAKRTHHVVLDIEELPLPFVVGDSIGLWPENDPDLVHEVLSITGLSAEAPVNLRGATRPLAEALGRERDLVLVDARLVKFLDEKASAGEHVVDVLRRAKKKPTAAELVDLLRPQTPRLYSIASSQLSHPGEVHLLVDIVRYELHGTERWGVVSRQIAERSPPGTMLPIYLHPAPSFRLGDPGDDMIFIGPGTGVAPFRAFLQERQQRRDPGRSWLFFGSQHRATDFLYESDFDAFQSAGVLTRIDTAFSRDQSEKIYVQHRMAEHGRELFAWIEAGARVYVCGDKDRMAAGVHEALVGILVEHGGLHEAVARQRLDRMVESGHYQRDVY